MKRIDKVTVEYTPREQATVRRFDYYLARGHTIASAAELALNQALRNGPVEDSFIEHLSEGTVTRSEAGWVSTGNRRAS